MPDQVIAPNEARVNITFANQNGELPDPVSFDATDADVKAWVAEAIRTGGVPGIPATQDVNLADFIVERCGPTEARPHSLLLLRPKTAFGA